MTTTAVTAPMPPGSLDQLHGSGHAVVQLDATQPLVDHIGSADAVISVLTDRVDRSVLQAGAAGRLRIVANVAAGYDNIDVGAARELGIAVTNTPGVLDESTADLAFALALMARRGTGGAERALRAGRWRGWTVTGLMGHDVHGATLGVVGWGRIGRAVALHDGTIFGAGIDVFEHEPTVHPRLLTAPNAVLLPHIGSATVATRTAMARMAASSVLAVLDGRRPEHLVTDPRNRP